MPGRRAAQDQEGRHRRRRADGAPARDAVPRAGSSCRSCIRDLDQDVGRRARSRTSARSSTTPRARGPHRRRTRRASSARSSPARPAYEGFADCDFVLEAVFEEMDVKQQVFGELERVVSPDCILATNTSSLSVTEMGADLEHPERLVGLHFFNPVEVLPLVELDPHGRDRRRHRRDHLQGRDRPAQAPRARPRTRPASSSTAS